MDATEDYIAEREKKILAELLDMTSSKFYKEAFEEGYKKGVHNLNVQSIKKMNEKDMSNSFIAEILEVTEAFVEGVIAGTIVKKGIKNP